MSSAQRLRLRWHSALGAASGPAAAGQAPLLLRGGPRQAAARDRLLGGDSAARLPDRLACGSVKLLHRLLGALLLVGVVALLLLALWLGSSKKCDECKWWARTEGAEGAEKYGTQYFALCVAIKDQHQDIREWVAHHQAVGAGKVYLYDTGSSPPLNETFPDHITSQLVEYIWWGPADFGTEEARKSPQNVIYADCMERYGSHHQFLGFIDSDEFIVLRGGTSSVPALLQHMMAFEPFGTLVINWRMFGSSGHKKRPKKGVLQSYTRCMPTQNQQSVHVKSIVNTQHYRRVDGPHHWLYKKPYSAVNEHFQIVRGPTTRKVSIDKIALHHYVLKSKQEFREKMERGSCAT